MLGKLLKYEMKSTSRIMWFLYAAVIVFGTIIGIAIRVQVNSGALKMNTTSLTSVFFGLPQIILTVFIIIYMLLLLALAVMTIIIIIMRFNNNLLRGEGYLMHTLPVKPWQLITSKGIVAVAVVAVSIICAVLSIFILVGINDMAGEFDLLHEYLFPAANMEPGTAEEQEALQKRLAELNHPWPEHSDDVSVLVHSYAGDQVEMTVAAHGVNVKVSGGVSIDAVFGWGEPEPFVVEEAFIAAPPVHWMGVAGWKDGKLSLLARTVEGPFVFRAEAVPTAEGLEMAISGIGVEERTVQLIRQ